MRSVSPEYLLWSVLDQREKRAMRRRRLNGFWAWAATTALFVVGACGTESCGGPTSTTGQQEVVRLPAIVIGHSTDLSFDAVVAFANVVNGKVLRLYTNGTRFLSVDAVGVGESEFTVWLQGASNGRRYLAVVVPPIETLEAAIKRTFGTALSDLQLTFIPESGKLIVDGVVHDNTVRDQILGAASGTYFAREDVISRLRVLVPPIEALEAAIKRIFGTGLSDFQLTYIPESGKLIVDGVVHDEVLAEQVLSAIVGKNFCPGDVISRLRLDAPCFQSETSPCIPKYRLWNRNWLKGG